MIVLRDYQQIASDEIRGQWTAGARNVCCVMPTGAGKTVLLAHEVRENTGPTWVIAHRQELVCQISVALARNGVRHRIVAPAATIRFIVSQHLIEVGRSWYEPNSMVCAAGVDTLINRAEELGAVLQSATLWVIDECHHLIQKNKWGKAVALMPNARGLGVTATPTRADGFGLGRDNDGVFDCIVEGPTMRELINRGFLTDYRIFAPPSDLDLSTVSIGATGDYTKPGLKSAIQRSTIMGDVVKHYVSHASGCLGVTFATDVETATDIAREFNEAGVSAAVVSAKTKPSMRVEILRRFKNKEIMQLVNVDLFGEGFDLPAIEVISMARPTASYALFAQQFGRGLRIMDGKTEAKIIDHVGNTLRHGLPDAPREWTLDRRAKRASSVPDDVIPTTVCPDCTAVYERIYKECPYCGFVPQPVARNGPEFVDGDLTELDAETLAAMRGEVTMANQTSGEYRMELMQKGCPTAGQAANIARHERRKTSRGPLMDAIAIWAGYERAAGRPDSQSYRKFYLRFGVDTLTAQTLDEKETMLLTEKINGAIK